MFEADFRIVRYPYQQSRYINNWRESLWRIRECRGKIGLYDNDNEESNFVDDDNDDDDLGNDYWFVTVNMYVKLVS